MCIDNGFTSWVYGQRMDGETIELRHSFEMNAGRETSTK